MTPRQDDTHDSIKRGGLPDGDVDLAALASSALGTSRNATKAAPSGPPQPAGAVAAAAQPPAPPAPSAAPPQPRRSAPSPSATTRENAPAADPSASDDRFTQVTSIVEVEVLERFKAYQLDQKVRTKEEPSNTVVVFLAINAAVKDNKVAELNNAPADDADGFLAIHAPGRRTSRERRRTDQLSWRPTFGNLEMIDGLWPEHGFKDRSQFINAVLDAFLPEAKRSRRSKR